MALFKIHKDLIAQDPNLLPFLFRQFDGSELDVTTVQDAINRTEAYCVSGPGVPSSGQLDFTFSINEDPEIPEGAIVLKEKYPTDHGDYLVWYTCH